MRNFSIQRSLAIAAVASLMVPATLIPTDVEARPNKRYDYKEWRGRDGRTYCRKSDGTTGLVIGAAGGALLGRTVDTNGDRTMGTLLGAAAGGLIGKSVDSGRKCR